MVHVGFYYKNGIGTSEDPEKAFRWTKKGADSGDIRGMSNLASFYYTGYGTEKNPERVFFWTEKAANGGSPSAMNNLGVAYEKGIGVTQNRVMARHWFQKAVRGGYVFALISLGFFHPAIIDVTEEADRDELETALRDLQSTVVEIKKSHRVTQNIGESVAHFTTLSALHSMLCCPVENDLPPSHHLRCYNIAYVNDPTEGKRLLDVASNQHPIHHFFPDNNQLTPHQIEWEEQEFSLYVGSFTLREDRLDLWRAYGKNGEGYSIVIPLDAFDAPERESSSPMMVEAVSRTPFISLVDLMGGEGQEKKETEKPVEKPEPPVVPLELYRVEYDKNRTKNGTLKKLREPLRKVRALRDALKSKEASEQVNRIVQVVLSDILYLYKSHEYSTEEEVRILALREISSDGLHLDEAIPPRVYAKTREFLFERPKFKIIVGPRVPDPTAAVLDLRFRLARHGLFGGITEVKASEVKYR